MGKPMTGVLQGTLPSPFQPVGTWLRGAAVERRSLTGELSLSCA